MDRGKRLGLLAAAVVVVIVAVVLIGSGGNSKSGSGAKRPAGPQQVQVRGGKPVGGIKKLEYTKGDRIRFVVHSDVADEIHVHGYDVHKDVPKNGQVSFDFPGKIDGSFVVELEGAKEQIASLEVAP